MQHETALDQYRPIFSQQRMFNYVSMILAILALGVTYGLVSIEASAGWLYAVPFIMFYGIMVLSARVRSNPLIRCTIENADMTLYSNLWRWSVIAGLIVFALYALGQVIIWQVLGDTLVLTQAQFIGLSAINGFLIASVAFE